MIAAAEGAKCGAATDSAKHQIAASTKPAPESKLEHEPQSRVTEAKSHPVEARNSPVGERLSSSEGSNGSVGGNMTSSGGSSNKNSSSSNFSKRSSDKKESNSTEDEDGLPRPSAVLISSRNAVQMLRQPDLLYGNNSSVQNNLPVPDLPPIIAVQQLQWALLLLRDVSVQALLRKQLAISMLEIVSKHLNSNVSAIAGNTNVAFAAGSRITSSADGSSIRMPFEDLTVRRVFQLCQISYSSYDEAVPALDQATLRVVLPLLLMQISRDHMNSDHGAAQQDQSLDDAAKTAAIASRAKALVGSTLKDAAAALGEQSSAEDGSGVDKPSCFTHGQLLQELLESVTKHILTMLQKTANN